MLTPEPAAVPTPTSVVTPPTSWGRRFTERYLLPFFGPAQLRAQDAATAPTDADREREAELRSGLERVTGPDGRAYVVERRGQAED